MNNHLSSGVRLLSALLVCLALNACVAPRIPVPGEGFTPIEAAQHYAEQGRYRLAAELYARAARQEPRSTRRNELQLTAAIAALRADRIRMATHLLASVDPSGFDPATQQRYELAQKLLHIAPMPPQKALGQLPPPPPGTSPRLAAIIWKTRAQLLFEQYKYVAGIHNLVQRSVWLLDKQAARRNNHLIFKRALEAVKRGRGPDSPYARQAGKTTLGWLRLAAIKLHGPQGGPALKRVLEHWEQRFTGHPATGGFLLAEFRYKAWSSPRPRTAGGLSSGPVVLFLPLSGNIARPAQAILAGIEIARGNGGATRPLRVIDSTGMSAATMLERARSTGAALILGPLKKSRVAALARRSPSIPVLALNQVSGVPMPPWFYRYALAPEDDARTAAEHAAAAGRDEALVLVPRSNWGMRVLNAFRNAFSRTGGRVIDFARFSTNRYDHQPAVLSVLQTRQTGEPADFIFIAARPAHARILRSQLRYFHAARLPVIATSDVYSGHPAPRKDADLNGVEFAAVPWIISDNPTFDALRHQAQKRAGHAAERFPRLFAMGVDAWRLTRKLVRRGLQPGMTIEGLTGVLEVTAGGRIRRHMAWAHFVNGRARRLEPATAAGGNFYRSGVSYTQPATAADTNGSRQQPSTTRSPTRGSTGAGNQRTQQPADSSRYGPVYSGPPDSGSEYGPVY